MRLATARVGIVEGRLRSLQITQLVLLSAWRGRADRVCCALRLIALSIVGSSRVCLFKYGVVRNVGETTVNLHVLIFSSIHESNSADVLKLLLLFLVDNNHALLCYWALICTISESLIGSMTKVWRVAFPKLCISANWRFSFIACISQNNFDSTSTRFHSGSLQSSRTLSSTTCRSHATALRCVCWILFSSICVGRHSQTSDHHWVINRRHALLNKAGYSLIR